MQTGENDQNSPFSTSVPVRESIASAKEVVLFNNPPPGNPMASPANVPLPASTPITPIREIVSQQPTQVEQGQSLGDQPAHLLG